MKYLKIFNTDTEYQNFSEGDLFVLPNISYIKTNKGLKFTPYIPPLAAAGDVAYWDGSSVKTTPLSSWSTSLGTPVGVVVVPEGFAPDGRARIIGLWGVDENGNQSNSYAPMTWGPVTDTSLTNYTNVPLTDNAGSTSTGSNNYGYLPSDKFTGTTSYVDSKVKYNMTYNMIPSPYLGDAPNPEYYKTISGNNALSDFNGLSNTETLVGLGTGYTAANAAWKYNDGTSNLQWYLPGMGELGYILPRFNVINNTITALGSLAITNGYSFWSSSEYNRDMTYYVDIYNALVSAYFKDDSFCVRPFAILDDGEDSGGGLTSPVYLIRGHNGELGIAVFNYFKENYTFGMHTLDDNTQVYIDNELQSTVVVTANVTFGEYLLLDDGSCNLQSS